MKTMEVTCMKLNLLNSKEKLLGQQKNSPTRKIVMLCIYNDIITV